MIELDDGLDVEDIKGRDTSQSCHLGCCEGEVIDSFTDRPGIDSSVYNEAA